jgi:preprotein translocase subunit SecG
VVTVLLEVTEGGNTVSAEKTSNSGAKGFAIILGSMVGIIGILWLIGALLSSH